MTDNYKAPFEGGKTPDPARTAKVKNIAKNLARKAMKKAAAVKESAVPERPYRKVYEPTSAQELNPGLRAKIDAASNAQKPRPLSGMRPIDKIKLMTRKEEVELDEAFINGREFAAHGLMHPKHAGEPIHRVADHYVDFYASGTGDKMQGKVKLNDGKSVHIQAHPKTGDGKLHKFKVSTDLPKTNEEVELDEAATKPKSVWQQAAIDGRKKGTELGKKTAEEFHKNVNAKGIHKGHPEHSDLFYKHVDKFSYKKLSKNFTTKGVNDAVAEHASNAAHNTFMRHIDKLHDTAMKKDPAYKAKFDKNEADNEKRSEQYRKDYELANDIVSRKVHPTRHGTPSPEAMHAAMINHYGDAEGNLPRHMGGRGTSAERARAHYNMWVAGTGGHGDRGYRYEEVDLEEAKDSREYDYEGDMAMSQLKSVITHAQKLHDMLDPDTNLPEWVQSKITLAEDYIVTAANYMDGEMNEEVEQVEEGLVGDLARAYFKPKAKAAASRLTTKVARKFGATPQTQRRLAGAAAKWASNKLGEEAEQIEEKKMGYEKLASAIKDRVARKKLAVEAHDPVGKEDADINNDGKTDKTDVYLHTKRRAIGKAISTRLAAKAGK